MLNFHVQIVDFQKVTWKAVEQKEMLWTFCWGRSQKKKKKSEIKTKEGTFLNPNIEVDGLWL